MAEKILVVDDDLDTVRLVGLMLERQGYQINAASSGQQERHAGAGPDEDGEEGRRREHPSGRVRGQKAGVRCRGQCHG